MYEHLPAELKRLKQFTVWKTGCKVPLRADGKGVAKPSDASTWASFDRAINSRVIRNGGGIGFVVTEYDQYCFLDLDACFLSPGLPASWAKEILYQFTTYTEISPSSTGLRIICEARSPFETGKIWRPEGGGSIELYDRRKVFRLTGWLAPGSWPFIEKCQNEVSALAVKYYRPPKSIKLRRADYAEDQQQVIDRAWRWLSTIEPAEEGKGGHNKTWHAASGLVWGFCLDEQTAMSMLMRWNERCIPPWSEAELLHKVRSAAISNGSRPQGYLRDAERRTG